MVTSPKYIRDYGEGLNEIEGGFCAYNPMEKKMYWDCSDSDGIPEEEIRSKFLSIPGVDSIYIGDEEGRIVGGESWIYVDWKEHIK